MALPLPLLSLVLATIACGLVWRLDIGQPLARALFTGVFALIGLSTVLTGLRCGYGMEALLVGQRLIPIVVGPLIYLGFLSLTGTAMARPLMIHLGIAVFAGAVPQLIPGAQGAYDAVIVVSYLCYAILLVRLWRRGSDALSLAPLHLTRGLRTWMLVAAAMLAVMMAFDTAIAVSFAIGRPEEAEALIGYGSLLSALSLIAAIVAVSSRAPPPVPQPVAPRTDTLEQKARTLLEDQRLFLDTDLTLDRLAKRLHVPARALSEVINRTQNMNVSQYVNGFRLSHAAHLLETTDLTVTQVTEQSGFLTRSNFYREFERVFAMSPTAYRKAKRP
ncbi:helix-turn-helix domain-containing protein [Jannaschia sp. CCS1]|uniref:helix-turn-helix domain-containing protein n=1 Tax=Jannaschia sp. (strain CCS1) TaxID=290400 RepID=UPI000053B001|nr:helix-turn-helix transcriptional regulator [Jannaschia sp. CCS1]ABD53649.1 transcriptional regulator, AraC family [Jannaschia sp. CCS1]